jgi:hypothetical protein
MRSHSAIVIAMVLFFGLVCDHVTCAAADSNSDPNSARVYANQTLEGLKGLMAKGTQSLKKIVSGKEESNVDESMRQLQETVLAASERARRLSEWDLSKVEKDAEAAFDTTIGAIEDYLQLVADDGIVHQAANRIRTAALEQSRIFREKASAKSSKRYSDLADAMDVQARKVSEIWDSIKSEREIATNGLKELKSSRELYIDVKKAQGIEAAVKELERVKNDLVKLSEAMSKVQQAVIGEAAKVAKPTTPAK